MQGALEDPASVWGWNTAPKAEGGADVPVGEGE